MLRWLVVFIVALFFAGAAFAQTVTLRPRIEASGQAVTLGDIFDGAGRRLAAPSRQRRRLVRCPRFRCNC